MKNRQITSHPRTPTDTGHIIIASLMLLALFSFSRPAKAYFKTATPNITTKKKMLQYRQQTSQNTLSIGINLSGTGFQEYNFPPLDIVPTSPPVYSALRNHIVQEESIEATLYANIKLRRTIQEYLQIQEKAKELLKDLDIGENQYLTRSESDSTTLDFRQFQQLLANITNEFQGLTKKASSIINQQKESLPPKTANITPAEQLNTPQAKNISTHNYIRGLIASSTYTNLNPSPSPRTTSPAQRNNNFDQEVTLPWVIRVPLNIFHYLMSHGIEALIYGALVLIAISILSAMRAGK